MESVVATCPSSVQMSMFARLISPEPCTETFPIAARVSIGHARRTCTHAIASGEPARPPDTCPDAVACAAATEPGAETSAATNRSVRLAPGTRAAPVNRISWPPPPTLESAPIALPGTYRAPTGSWTVIRMLVTVRVPGFPTMTVYGIASPTPTSSTSAVKSSPSAALGGPTRATWAAAATWAAVPCAWRYARLRTSTVSRTVGATTATRSIAPLSPAASVPRDQVSTWPATAGADVALRYWSPVGSVSVRTALSAGAEPAALA